MPKKSKPEPISERIARLKIEKIVEVLSMVHAETEGLITLPESLKTGANALVYDMSILILAMLEKMSGKKARKWKELQVLNHKVIPLAKAEIEELYAAIRKVGLVGGDAAEAGWKEAALTRFHDSKKGFQAIMREDLADDNLYRLNTGKEKRDFTTKLLQKVLDRIGFGKYGMDMIADLLKKNKLT